MHRSKFLKLSILFLAVVLVASFSLFGCKKEVAPAEEEVVEEEAEEAEPVEEEEAAKPMIEPGELEVGVLWEEGTWFDIVKEIGDSMIKDFPGTEIIYTFNNTAALPAIEARTLAGDPLDVHILFDSMDPRLHQWVDDGHVLDITDAMNEVRDDGTMWKDDFLPIFLTPSTYKSSIWGAPEQVYIWLVHYNKKMFDDWGKTPPTTWAEMLDLCEWIKTNGNGVAPIALTGQVDFYVGMWWDYLTQRYVGTDKVREYLYGDTDAKLVDDPGYLKAAQEMNKLFENEYLVEGWEATDFTTVQIYFFQEKAAMILMGSWLMTEMKDSIPEGFELAVAPFPQVDGGKGSQDALFGAARPWNVMAKSDVPELATEYLRRFTSKEISTKRSELLGAVSPCQGVPAPQGIGGISEVMENASNAEFIYYNYGVVGGEFGIQAAWYTPIVEMCMGKLTPEEALSKIDKNFEAIRSQRKEAAE